MTNEPVPNGTLVALTAAVENLTTEVEGLRADQRSKFRRLWQWVAGVAVTGVAAMVLVFLLYNQSHSIDRKVDRAIERSDRIEVVVDRSVRVPLCTFLHVALSRPVVGLTPEQLKARATYVLYYGAGTPEKPGLNCPESLPEAAAGGG